jgi:cyclopropane fatty-acyl-phospholipid synthase-like methyltransferase
MADSQPPRPAPIPAPDRHQIERLNALYELDVPGPRNGWRGRVVDRLRAMLARILFRQQEFNAALVDHINRNAGDWRRAHIASERMIVWFNETMRATTDEVQRYHQALRAREHRSDAAVTALTAAHEELRASLGVLHQAAQNLKREMTRLAEKGVVVAAAPVSANAAVASAAQLDTLDSHKYVGFEDQFRGSQADIRERVSEYLDIFQGATDVLDIGCGRGEFLSLLRERGVRARGIDLNGAMVDVCRQQGLDATEADALTYLHAQPDSSLGGLFAAQVIEHLDPRYLTSLLDAAFEKLRPERRSCLKRSTQPAGSHSSKVISATSRTYGRFTLTRSSTSWWQRAFSTSTSATEPRIPNTRSCSPCSPMRRWAIRSRRSTPTWRRSTAFCSRGSITQQSPGVHDCARRSDEGSAQRLPRLVHRTRFVAPEMPRVALIAAAAIGGLTLWRPTLGVLLLVGLASRRGALRTPARPRHRTDGVDLPRRLAAESLDTSCRRPAGLARSRRRRCCISRLLSLHGCG